MKKVVNKQNNAVNVLFPYKTQYQTWVYDDEDLGVYTEAFVMGSSEVIDHLIGADATHCKVLISSQPLPKYDALLEKINAKEGEFEMEGWYQIADKSMPPNWLCGRCCDYFPGYPEQIYVKIDRVDK